MIIYYTNTVQKLEETAQHHCNTISKQRAAVLAEKQYKTRVDK